MSGSTPRRTVLVGVDGSTNSSRALDWAIHEAARRDLDVTIVHVVDTTAVAVPYFGYTSPVEEDTERGAAIVEAALDRAARVDPAVHVRSLLLAGNPADTVVDAAHDATLVVVGSRGVGALSAALFGSVSDRLASRSPVPVVVLPADGPHPPFADDVDHEAVPGDRPDGIPSDERPAGAPTGGLVRVNETAPVLRDHVAVGVDGSRAADVALLFALDEAACRQAPVLVVSAWHTPPGPVRVDRAEAEGEHQRDGRAAARKAAVVCVEDALLRTRTAAHGGVPVEIWTAEGTAGRAIHQASRGAALTVVGSRSRGTVRGMLLGSVSRDVLRHADGPVVVVHAPKD